MKAEHRKELERNALAEGMGRMIQGMKEKPKGRSVLLWLGVLVAVVAVAIGIWWWNGSKQNQAQTWVMLDAAGELQSLVSIGFGQSEGGKVDLTSAPKTQQAKMAQFQIAWYLLYDAGIKNLLFSRGAPDDSFKNITQARDAFTRLSVTCADDPVLFPESLYAIAVAEETLAVDPIRTADQLKAAEAAYLNVKEKCPNSALAKDAEKRAKALSEGVERERIGNFYANLARQVEQRRDLFQNPAMRNPALLKQIEEKLKK